MKKKVCLLFVCCQESNIRLRCGSKKANIFHFILKINDLGLKTIHRMVLSLSISDLNTLTKNQMYYT